jgi:hypothetical protein
LVTFRTSDFHFYPENPLINEQPFIAFAAFVAAIFQIYIEFGGYLEKSYLYLHIGIWLDQFL